MIPILYNKCSAYSGFAKFDTHKIRTSTDGSVVISGECCEVGHIFCGTHKDPDYSSQAAVLHGEFFQVFGGSLLEIIKVNESGDEITLSVVHDGSSPEVLIIYGTKNKNT